LIVLVAEETVGKGEYAALYLKACRNDVTIVGAKTNGATGNVTNIQLPGPLFFGFTVLGLLDSDGKHLRNGIQPDILVSSELNDIRSGKDVILEKAVEHAKSMIASRTKKDNQQQK